MRRIAILTAGGDTPALNATIFGAVERANQLKIEVVGVIRGFAGMLDERLPHVRLNPLFSTIPELDPCMGGTLLGASRTYIDPEQTEVIADVKTRLRKLKIDGLAVGTFSTEALSRGINLATLNTPMLKQALEVHALTIKHNNMHAFSWRSIQTGLAADASPYSKQNAMYALDKLDNELVAEQRAAAQPRPHRYELALATDTK